MGNEIIKEKLYRSIAKKDSLALDSILSKYPQFVNSILTSDSKMTPLLKAVVHNNLYDIEMIIGYGGNPDLANSKGITPLMLSAIRNNIVLVQYFVEKHRVNMSASCNQGFTALDYSIFGGHYQISQYLYNLNPLPLKQAVIYEDYRKKQKGRYVNYEVFLNHLTKKLPKQSLPQYLQIVSTILLIQNPSIKTPQSILGKTGNSQLKEYLNFKIPPSSSETTSPSNSDPKIVMSQADSEQEYRMARAKLVLIDKIAPLSNKIMP